MEKALFFSVFLSALLVSSAAFSAAPAAGRRVNPPDPPYGAGTPPPFSGTLTKEEIMELKDYLRKLCDCAGP